MKNQYKDPFHRRLREAEGRSNCRAGVPGHRGLARWWPGLLQDSGPLRHALCKGLRDSGMPTHTYVCAQHYLHTCPPTLQCCGGVLQSPLGLALALELLCCASPLTGPASGGHSGADTYTEVSSPGTRHPSDTLFTQVFARQLSLAPPEKHY